MKIVVVGASRGVGRSVLDLALRRGHEVTGVARSKPPFTHARLGWFRGSVLSYGVLDHVVRGADAVVTTVRFDGRGATTSYGESAELVVGAMSKAGVRRLIAVTGLGVLSDPGLLQRAAHRLIGSVLLRGHRADKLREEALIGGSHLDWTVVRPGILVDAAPVVRLSAQRDVTHLLSTRGDVATFIVGAVAGGLEVRRIVSIP